jgi:hypothetical protein
MFGEQYVFSSCANKCKKSSCPLKNPPRYEVCVNQFPDRIGTIFNNEYLVFFTKSNENIYTNRYFVCDDGIKCLEYSKVCDLVEDCDDGSDEVDTKCTNHFKCKSENRRIPKNKKCDLQFDCYDMSDECNEECSTELLEGSHLKIISMIVGNLAVIANLVIIIKNLGTLKNCKTSVALVNKSLIILISFGDLMVGCYLLVVAIYDIAIFKQGYCIEQIKWTISLKCSIIGVFSTIGSQVSLFAMAGLSTVRLHGIRGSLRVPGEVTMIKSLKVATGVLFIILSSSAIAIAPIISTFEDFFVNGIKYPEELKMFIGPQEKQRILPVLEAYYGRMKNTTMSWETIVNMVKDMFSHDVGSDDHTEAVTKLDFYGNDGVCLFKYFVNNDDTQTAFVWAVLILNFVCFLFITISYIAIGVVSRNSSRTLANAQNQGQADKRNRRMNRRISIIIATDFCCWIPFITISALHYLEVVNATPWYGIFSMIILPINSVINPFLYDDLIVANIKAPFVFFSNKISNSAVYLSFIAYFTPAQIEEIEMDEVETLRQ